MPHVHNLPQVFLNRLMDGLRTMGGASAYQDLMVSKIAKAKGITYSEAGDVLSTWSTDPLTFLSDCLQSPYYWEKQAEIITAIRDHNRVIVRSGNGVGKGWIAARTALWYLFTRFPSIVITTSTTDRQVRKLLWGELRSAYRYSKVKFGDCLAQELNISEDWYAIGFCSRKETEKFQGFHSPNILIIFDEASGIDKEVWDAVEGNMTSLGAKWLAIGNPIETNGPFFDNFKSDNWHKIHIDSEESPNVVQGKIVISGLVTREWCESRARDYGGKESPLYQIKVKGNFSEMGTNNVITLRSLNNCKDLIPDDKSGRHMGVDIARFGDDSSRAVLMVDGRVEAEERWIQSDTMYSVGKIRVLMAEWKIDIAENVHIDVIGIGAGVVDRLKELGIEVDDVNFGESPKYEYECQELIGGNVKFKNRRAELYWRMKRNLEVGSKSIPEKFGEAWADLTAVNYKFTSEGAILLEGKDEVKKKLGRSPDLGDAIICCLSRRESIHFRKL